MANCISCVQKLNELFAFTLLFASFRIFHKNFQDSTVKLKLKLKKVHGTKSLIVCYLVEVVPIVSTVTSVEDTF